VGEICTHFLVHAGLAMAAVNSSHLSAKRFSTPIEVCGWPMARTSCIRVLMPNVSHYTSRCLFDAESHLDGRNRA
jgi:hypothetical protein